jgi:hypothetical protein
MVIVMTVVLVTIAITFVVAVTVVVMMVMAAHVGTSSTDSVWRGVGRQLHGQLMETCSFQSGLMIGKGRAAHVAAEHIVVRPAPG